MALDDAQIYALLHQGNPGDRNWYVDRCAGASRVLELGSGYGRISIALAEAGLETWGVERDAGLVEVARARTGALSSEVRSRLQWLDRDMTQLSLDNRFERILLPYNGFFCLVDEDEVRRLLRVVAEHLAPGGEFLFDVWAAEGFHEALASGELHPEGPEEELGTLETAEGPATVYERCDASLESRKLSVVYRLELPSGDRELPVPQKYWLREEIEALLQAEGLRVLEVLERFPDEHEDEERWVFSVAAAG